MEDNIIDRLKEYKGKIQNRIEKEMHNLVPKFKEYVREDHPEYPKHILIEGIWYRNTYGCENDRYYYFWIKKDIQFRHRYNLWEATALYYDDKHKWWYVYDKNKNQYAEFTSLDVEPQTEILEQLYNLLK